MEAYLRLFLTFLRVFAFLYLLFFRLLFNFRRVLTRLCFLFLDLDIFRRLILDLLPDLLPPPPPSHPGTLTHLPPS